MKENQFTFSKLHEEFIEKSRRPMEFGRLPVYPVETSLDVPIIVTNKWVKITRDDCKCLTKTFRFRQLSDRNRFVEEVLDCELKTQHSSEVTVKGDAVVITVSTAGIDQVTEIDTEAAKNYDVIFREIIYNLHHENACR